MRVSGVKVEWQAWVDHCGGIPAHPGGAQRTGSLVEMGAETEKTGHQKQVLPRTLPGVVSKTFIIFGLSNTY